MRNVQDTSSMNFAKTAANIS